MTDERIAKLPRWARTELHRLTTNCRIAEDRLAEAYGSAKTPIEIDAQPESTRTSPRCFLSPHSRIRYTLPRGYIEVSIRDDRVEIYAEGGSDRLSMRGHAANVMSVGFEKQ